MSVGAWPRLSTMLSAHAHYHAAMCKHQLVAWPWDLIGSQITNSVCNVLNVEP